MTEQTTQRLAKLTPDQWPLVRDIYFPIDSNDSVEEAAFEKAFCYVGDPRPRALWDPSDPIMIERVQNVFLTAFKEQVPSSRQAFRLQAGEMRFRAHREQTDAGPRLVLRAIPKETPQLAQLRMPHAIRQLLLDPDLLQGGLVLITATNGQGKTTTASATVRSRLELFSGHANTVEDPPELPLHGFHVGPGDTRGRCDQIPVDPEDPNTPGSEYAMKLRSTLRMFPAIGGGTILFVGEIRDSETAAETILAAANGHLVIATAFGHSISGAITRLAAMCQERLGAASANDLIAGNLRACIFQRLFWRKDGEGWERGELRADALHVPSPTHAIANALRNANFSGITTAIERQRGVLQAFGDSQPSIGEIKKKLSEITV